MDSKFWDERYGQENYAYGTEPNEEFSKLIAAIPPGRILLPAEGEGRNAVYAASLGWEVHCFDQSAEGRKKAMALAEKMGQKLEYQVAGFESYEVNAGYFDCVALIFAHLPAAVRSLYFRKVAAGLKPGGKLIVTGYSKAQLGKTSGGPQDISMLFSAAELRHDFEQLRETGCREIETFLSEGPLHSGLASLILFEAEK